MSDLDSKQTQSPDLKLKLRFHQLLVTCFWFSVPYLFYTYPIDKN